tara:strand:+ start:827 stop:2701 length:1875 start_codon:yes stop_codon:yes gene_type:complete
MIRLKNISKSFPDGDLFNNVNIFIKRGMRIGLVGSNGSGKTTLLRIMLGKESPDSGDVQVDKSITIGHLSQDIVAGTERSILEEVLNTYPEISDLEGKILSLSDAISKDHNNMELINKLGDAQHRFESLGGWNLEDKAKKILSGLGFSDEQFTQPMDVFSGGWRMRVALASILLQEPDILFLDEPTNHLDLEATIWLELFLSNWRGGLVMISHDRSFLDRSINNILEIDLKKITLYYGNYTKFTEEKALRIEQHKNAYRNQQKQIKNTQRFIDRFRSKSSKATLVQSKVKMLDKLEKIEAPIEEKHNMHLRLPQVKRSPLNVISCQNVNKHYGDIKVFNNMDMLVERGEKIGLVGHNGAGKSTLLKMLAGVESVSSGAIQIGSNTDRAYYAQHQLETLDPNDTVFESIQKVSTGWSETEMRTYLGSFMFSGDEIKKYVKVLSGGEKARVALARMLIKPSHLLLLDEPTNHLDMMTRNVVERALIQFSGSIVCVSHDRHFLNNVTNLTCEVGGGNIRLFKGNYEYYEWKKQEEKSEETHSSTVKFQRKGNSNYREKKKTRNRLAWIEKRFKTIEKDINEQREITQDPSIGDDYELLQKAMGIMNRLEDEYLELMEEQEKLTGIDF